MGSEYSGLIRDVRDIRPGMHFCSIYKDKEEQFLVSIPYMALGLKNQKCIYIADENTKEEILAAFNRAGLDITKHLKKKQFVFYEKKDTYLKGGVFSPEEMIALLKQEEKEALKEGYSGLRVSGEMSWVFSHPSGLEKLLEYEAKLNNFFPGSKTCAICQYNEKKFPPELLLNVIHTHPYLFIYSQACENPFYLEPEVFLKSSHKKEEMMAVYYRIIRDELLEKARESVKAITVEDKYANLFDNITSGVAVYEAVDKGKDFIFRDFNKAAERIDNIKKENLLNKSVTKVFPGVKEFGLFEVFKRVWETGEPGCHPVTLYKDDRISGWRENYVFKLSSGEVVAIYDDVSRLKNKEAALKEKEKQYQQLVDSVNSVIIRINSKGEIGFINEYAQKLFGYTAEEVMGRQIVGLITPVSDTAGKNLEAMIKDIIANPRRYENNINENICRDGRRLWIAWTNKPVYDENGKVKEILSVGNNITDLKKVEVELRKSEERLNQLSENALDLIFQTNTLGIVTYSSAACEKFFGFKKEELSGRNFMDFVKKSDMAIALYGFKKNLSGENVTMSEVRVRNKKGEEITVEINASPLKINNNIEGVQGVIRDISERKRHEEEIARAKNYAQELIRKAPMAIFMVDKGRIVTHWNEMAAKITGYSAEEMIGKKCTLFSKDPCETKCGLYCEDVKKPVIGRKCRIKTKDGRDIDVLKNADLLKDEKGNVIAGIELFYVSS